MRPPPGYVPQNKSQEKKLQGVINGLIQKESKTMGVLTEKSRFQGIHSLTLRGVGQSQHQAMAVTDDTGRNMFWDANGIPVEGSELHQPRYNTGLCKDCNEYFHDAPQLAALEEGLVEDNIVILNNGKNWGVRDARGKVVVGKRDKLAPWFKPVKGEAPCMRPRLFSGLNSTSPQADVKGMDDITGGACAEWSLIFAVALRRFLRESPPRAAIAKWAAFQNSLFTRQRIEHNWAIQLVRRDLMSKPSEVHDTIYSILDNARSPAEWTNHEVRKLRRKHTKAIKKYFTDKGIWSTVLDIVYPEVTVDLGDLMESMSLATPRRSARTKFSYFGRRISPAHAYRLYRRGAAFGFDRTGTVIDLPKMYQAL